MNRVLRAEFPHSFELNGTLVKLLRAGLLFNIR
jgi:hypothetical protein